MFNLSSFSFLIFYMFYRGLDLATEVALVSVQLSMPPPAAPLKFLCLLV